MFSKRITEVEPSGTVALSNLVKMMEKKGHRIISFTLGEPDHPTPPHIIEAAKNAMDKGMTHYTSSLGILELREAIAKRAAERNGLKASTENVIVLPTKLAIYMAMQTLLDKDDEVIFPDPGWVSYGPMVQLAGGRPVPVRMVHGDGWRWDMEDVERSITKRTKALVMNTPANPTGSIVTRKEQEQIARIAADHDLTIISDEVYENLVYDEPHHSIGSLKTAKDRTITISGFSKSYAMTGWRLGWMIAGAETIKMVDKLQQHTLTCLPGFVQMGGVAALKGGDRCVEEMRNEFKQRRDLIIPLLNEIPGVSCESPKGAFYAFFRMEAQGQNDSQLAERLLKEAHVALTPGSAFGEAGRGYLRMSYAASKESLMEGIGKIDAFARKLV